MAELKRILIVPCADSPSITNEKGNKYVFRSHANGYQTSAGGAAVAATQPFKRWTVIGPDYSYGWDAWGTFVVHLLKHKPDVDILSIQAWPKLSAGRTTAISRRSWTPNPKAYTAPSGVGTS